MSEEAINTPEPTPEPVIEPVVEPAEPAPADNSAPADNADPAPAPADPEPKDKPKNGGFQKRIDELTRQRYESDQRAAQLQSQLDEQQRQVNQSNLQAQKPTLEAFNYDEAAWGQAMEQWAEQGFTQQQEERQQADQLRQDQTRQAEVSRRIQEKTLLAIEKYPDFQVKVNDPSVPSLSQISPAAHEALVTSDQFGEVAYYLASNPAEVYQFGSMSPIEAVRAVARLETKLSPTTQASTKAPPPPTKINGKSEANVDPDKLSTKDWMEMRAKETH